jgi:ABC-type antimicrobial peptide transport system permease subunit
MRAGSQLSAGVAVGIAIAAALDPFSSGAIVDAKGTVILPAVCVFAIAVGVLASMLPARRALRIDPTIVLKEE